MNIQNAKIELIQWLSTLDDSAMIQKLIEFRKKETKDWWINISDEEKKSIKRGISDAEKGKMKPHSEVRKIYEKWL